MTMVRRGLTRRATYQNAPLRDNADGPGVESDAEPIFDSPAVLRRWPFCRAAGYVFGISDSSRCTGRFTDAVAASPNGRTLSMIASTSADTSSEA